MSKHLQKPDLLIVSDTMIIKTNEGTIAFEPVVREIENFSEIFNNITWIGFEYDITEKQYSARECNNKNVKYITVPRVGGHNLKDKIKILLTLPKLFFLILSEIRKHKVIHTRGPSVPAIIAIIFSSLFKNKTFWHKFAGNWNQLNPPFSYGLQKKLLKKLNHTHVTINGKWDNQEKHLISFENPCITDDEFFLAKEIANKKSFESKLDFCFVGRLEDPKGVQFILDTLYNLENKSKIGIIHFIGDGKKTDEYKKFANKIELDIKFHGFLSRSEIDEIYKKSHFIMLPSYASEGFPKVIAEAAAYGCIPFVSDVSSIPQYVNNNNGIIINDVTKDKVFREFTKLLSLDSKELKGKSNNSIDIADRFTYSYYNKRIEKEILINA